MKICLRYPFPKSFPSGKGLAIAALKVFLLSDVWFMVSSLSLWAEVVQKYENMSTLPSLRSKLSSVRSSVHYTSCTINHAKIKNSMDYYIVITICINYFKNRHITVSFLLSKPHTYPTPATFGPLFVASTTNFSHPGHACASFCGFRWFPAHLLIIWRET